MAYCDSTYIGDAYEVTVNNQKVTLYVYIPDSIKSESTVNGTVYWNGASGYFKNPGEYQPISDYYSKNDNVDYVFIAMDDDRHYDGFTDEVIRQVVNQIQSKYNVNVDLNRFEGLSAGGDEAVDQVLAILRSNPAASPQQLVLYDPYSDDGKGFNYQLTSEDLRLMRQNDTTVFLSLPRNRGYNYRDGSTNESSFVNNLATNGIPTILVDGNFVHGHSASRMLYDGWTDYLNGYIDLEDINDETGKYNISVPIVGSDGKVTWQVYTLADLQEAKLHRNKYSAEELKGFNYALDQLDDMRVELDADDLIRRAGNLLTTFSNADIAPPTANYSSTSVLIPDSYAALTKIRDIFVKMCASAQREINYAINFGEKYIAMEADLTKNTEGLNTLMNDKLDDLRIPMVELEVEIDDPDLKKTQNVLSGGRYYGGGGYSSNEASNAEAVDETETKTETTEEVQDKAVEPKEKSEPNVIPTPINNRPTSGPTSNVTISDMIINDEEVVEPDTEITPEEIDVIDNSDIDTNDTQVPEIEPTPSYIPNSGRKSNGVVKTIGALTTAGAAVAAGVYGAKKYKEHQEGYDDEDDDNDSGYHSFDEAPKSNDEI